jgi:sugar phosphate isomerase/epimerase
MGHDTLPSSAKPVYRELSYPATLISWDGRELYFDAELARRELDERVAAGLRWVMVAALQFVEPARCDLADAARTYRRWLDDRGVRVASHHCIQPTWAPLEQSQAPVHDMMRRVADVCALIAPRALVLHPGPFLGGINTGIRFFEQVRQQIDRHGEGRILDTIAANLRVFGEACAGHGMKVAVENVGRFEPFASLRHLPAIVERADHPAVGYCIDSGHAHAFGESVTRWLRLAGAKLFETHFHDNRGLGAARFPGDGPVAPSGKIDEHFPPGFGTVDWIGVNQALNEIGFDGPVTFETTAWGGSMSVEAVRHAEAWWRQVEQLAVTREPSP